jgi:uncharacterized protein YbaA (DUF1428 family)
MAQPKDKAKYVDGFLIVIPKKNVEAYKKMAKEAGKIWKKYGAIDYKECMIDDSKPEGISLTFPKLVKTKPSETVWFSYITYKSKAHRDSVNTKVMKDPAMDKWNDKPMPFDMKRFSYAGFNVEVSE